jgi:hypothetical protein
MEAAMFSSTTKKDMAYVVLSVRAFGGRREYAH